MDPGQKILFADDSELFLELEKSIFARKGLELLVASDGIQALLLIREHHPNLAFLGLYMPNMGGDECCRKVKNDPALRAVPIIIVTQSSREEDLDRCRRAGCDDIVPKPIDRQRLMAAAAKFLKVGGRSAPRVTARLRIHFGATGQELLTDYSVNLSSGGLFIETEKLLPAETPLALEFIIPTVQRSIRCQGRVAWVNPSSKPIKAHLPAGMGIQFIDLALSDLEAIRDYIQKELVAPFW